MKDFAGCQTNLSTAPQKVVVLSPALFKDWQYMPSTIQMSSGVFAPWMNILYWHTWQVPVLAVTGYLQTSLQVTAKELLFYHVFRFVSSILKLCQTDDISKLQIPIRNNFAASAGFQMFCKSIVNCSRLRARRAQKLSTDPRPVVTFLLSVD